MLKEMPDIDYAIGPKSVARTRTEGRQAVAMRCYRAATALLTALDLGVLVRLEVPSPRTRQSPLFMA
jgi:hypothetical protein